MVHRTVSAAHSDIGTGDERAVQIVLAQPTASASGNPSARKEATADDRVHPVPWVLTDTTRRLLYSRSSRRQTARRQPHRRQDVRL